MPVTLESCLGLTSSDRITSWITLFLLSNVRSWKSEMLRRPHALMTASLISISGITRLSSMSNAFILFVVIAHIYICDVFHTLAYCPTFLMNQNVHVVRHDAISVDLQIRVCQGHFEDHVLHTFSEIGQQDLRWTRRIFLYISQNTQVIFYAECDKIRAVFGICGSAALCKY